MADQNPNSATAIKQTPQYNIWPVAGTKDYRVPRGKSGRSIGALRTGKSRTHAGIDLFGKHRDTVVAIAPGTIVSFYYFYRSTFALFIDHGDFVINYGEVAADSLESFGLKTPRYKPGPGKPMYTVSRRGGDQFPVLAKTGSSVSPGQPIARVGKMYRSSMLHIEFYAPGTLYNKQWNSPDGAAPSALRDGTEFLRTIATNIKKGINPTKEASPRGVVCR